VVLFNSLLEDDAVQSYVGQNAHQSGYVAAKLINYGLGKRRDVVLINLSARKDHYAHLIDREHGFRSFFEEHSGCVDNLITLDLNGVDDQVLHTRLEELWAHYNIGGIFVSNSRVYKVAEYLAKRGSMGVRLVGYDLLPLSVEYLKRDYIDFLISQRPEEQAYLGLSSLVNLVVMKRMPEARQWMPIDIITRENIPYYNQ
jgi:LacI family transcriptional regulator